MNNDQYKTNRKVCQTALDVQDACNLSGVLNSFLSVVRELRDVGYSTTDINKHPAVVLFSNKIGSLTNIETGLVFSKSYNLCIDITSNGDIDNFDDFVNDFVD